jgi:hypothetical protein
VRYADDCNVFVGSVRAGARVMASITKFLEGRTRLQVNAEKSAVRHPSQVHFLNFRFIPRQWVQKNYPLFLQALNAEPVAYKDFAKALADVMPRKRLEQWKDGKRLGTHRYYLVQDPAINVVPLTKRDAS